MLEEIIKKINIKSNYEFMHLQDYNNDGSIPLMFAIFDNNRLKMGLTSDDFTFLIDYTDLTYQSKGMDCLLSALFSAGETLASKKANLSLTVAQWEKLIVGCMENTCSYLTLAVALECKTFQKLVPNHQDILIERATSLTDEQINAFRGKVYFDEFNALIEKKRLEKFFLPEEKNKLFKI